MHTTLGDDLTERLRAAAPEPRGRAADPNASDASHPPGPRLRLRLERPSPSVRMGHALGHLDFASRTDHAVGRKPKREAHGGIAVAAEERWSAYLTDDEPPEVAFYCLECAEREFK